MVILNIKKLILSGSLVLFYAFVFGQKAPFIIVSDIEKKCFYPGDTLSFTIKNLTSFNRGYTIEVACIDTHLKLYTAYNEVYTAYFNHDTSFFKKIKESEKSNNEDNIGHIIPDFQLLPHDIRADSLSTFVFVLTGNRMKTGIKIKLIIYPNLVDGNPDVPIETKPFYVFAKAM